MDEREGTGSTRNLLPWEPMQCVTNPVYFPGPRDWWLHQRGNQQPRGRGEAEPGLTLLEAISLTEWLWSAEF